MFMILFSSEWVHSNVQCFLEELLFKCSKCTIELLQISINRGKRIEIARFTGSNKVPKQLKTIEVSRQLHGYLNVTRCCCCQQLGWKRPIVFQYMMETPLFAIEMLLKFWHLDNYPKTFEFSLNYFHWIQDKIQK